MSEEAKNKRTVTGVVISDKSSKTIVIKVDKKFMHPMYSKFITKTKKFHVHDENEKASIGDSVTVIESRPHSKLKRWELVTINK